MSNRGGRFNALTDTWAGLFFLEHDAQLTRHVPGLFPEPKIAHRICISTESLASGSDWCDRWREREPADDADVTILYESD